MLVKDNIIKLEFLKILKSNYIIIERSFELIKQSLKIQQVYNCVLR